MAERDSLPRPLGSLHADRMEIRRLRTERAELIEELELASEQGRLVGQRADDLEDAMRSMSSRRYREEGTPWLLTLCQL